MKQKMIRMVTLFLVCLFAASVLSACGMGRRARFRSIEKRVDRLETRVDQLERRQ